MAGELKVGDEVLSLEKGRRVRTRISRIYVAQDQQLRSIRHSGGELRSTGSHRFYVAGRGLVRAHEIEAGDMLALEGGELALVVSNGLLDEAETVYNFNLERGDNLLVSQEKAAVVGIGILIKLICCIIQALIGVITVIL